ncbi:MAG: GIY-YIG nuclease family protein [Gammaproteobacteria bacterium]|nr:GIY-YIG nuclease family protein [Gammaproteobacteria bacterium]
MRDKNYSEEVQQAFEKDAANGKRIGQVWKLSKEEKSPVEIAQELGVDTHHFVYNCRRCIKAIEDGVLPESTTSAKDCASALRGFAKRHYSEILSSANHSQIRAYAEQCERISSDQNKREEEDEYAEQQTQTALDSHKGPGIYVYTLPHYFRSPVAPSEDEAAAPRTYMKVGMSKSDVRERIDAQNTTALPEPIMVLRIWEPPEGVSVKDIENRMHNHLAAADHLRNRQKGAGKEWFLTHLKFLDATARLLNLKIKYEHRDKDETD